jgi:hypothetical protein
MAPELKTKPIRKLIQRNNYCCAASRSQRDLCNSKGASRKYGRFQMPQVLQAEQGFAAAMMQLAFSLRGSLG